MKRVFLWFSLALLLSFVLTGCGGGQASSTMSAAQQGAVFMTGGDAPLPSVLSFNVTINSMKLDGTTEILAQPTTVDFARLLGLRTLLAFNNVAAGTYHSVSITLASPTISVLNLTTTPPSTSSINGTFKDSGGNSVSSTVVTVALTRPLTVAASGLAGLHMDFNLRQSLAVDGTGQITGVVNPVITVKPVGAKDPDAEVNDLRGGLASVNVAGNSFMLQRPGGRTITVDVDANTEFSGSFTLATLPNPSILEVDGDVQADGSVLAEKVEVLTTMRAFVAGRVLAVNPATGPAQQVTLLVNESLPDISGVAVGTPVTFDVSQVTNYDIRHLDNWFTSFLFNSSTLVAGQQIAIAGTINSNTTPASFVPARVVLERQGVEGDLVANSVVINNGNAGSFQIQNNAMLGFILGGPLTVQTANSTNFHDINGLPAIQTGGAMRLAAFGLILKDQTTGAPVMFAHQVALLP